MHRIKNFKELDLSHVRHHALDIIEAGLEAIATDDVIDRSVICSDNELRINDLKLDLRGINRIHIIGFGKASCQAAASLERILGARLHSGIVIGNTPTKCETIRTYQGTHPLPSQANVKGSEQIVLRYTDMKEDDLVIVLVSGGGSALLCWPQTECDQGQGLYEASIHAGLTIQELNTVRKHISLLKGGGLAKLLFPARVVGMIFSDVPGTNYDMVASGPTYLDSSTVSDAEKVIEKYNLGKFTLLETPKEAKWFERVTNVVMVSNIIALNAMARTAQSLGYSSEIISSDLYEEPSFAIKKMCAKAKPKSAIFAGGEYRLLIAGQGGKGGRNQHAALTAMEMISSTQTFASFASDGLDNSDAAGALTDQYTRKRLAGLMGKVKKSISNFDDYGILEEAEALLKIGATESNVSDLAFLLTE